MTEEPPWNVSKKKKYLLGVRGGGGGGGMGLKSICLEIASAQLGVPLAKTQIRHFRNSINIEVSKVDRPLRCLSRPGKCENFFPLNFF